jgi:hypothetical protein
MISNESEDRGIMKIIKKDLTTIERGILCNQTNCQSVMRSGVALALKRKFPNLESEYIDFSKRFSSPSELLGQLQTVNVGEDLYVANLFGQNLYGYNGERYTSYGAWEKALPQLKEVADKLNLPVYFPYLVGSDRGGGNFIILSEMIKEYFPKAIFCKL